MLVNEERDFVFFDIQPFLTNSGSIDCPVCANPNAHITNQFLAGTSKAGYPRTSVEIYCEAFRHPYFVVVTEHKGDVIVQLSVDKYLINAVKSR